jgi:hypothetical protein
LKLLVAATLFGLAALPAVADEVWSTTLGDIIYEADLDNGTAVFSAPAQWLMIDAPADARAWIYIPDLAYLLDARSVHPAFWLVEGMEFCTTGMVAADGRKSFAWGDATIAFDVSTFPSGFTLIAGNCGYDAYIPIRAEPIVGN